MTKKILFKETVDVNDMLELTGNEELAVTRTYNKTYKFSDASRAGKDLAAALTDLSEDIDDDDVHICIESGVINVDFCVVGYRKPTANEIKVSKLATAKEAAENFKANLEFDKRLLAQIKERNPQLFAKEVLTPKKKAWKR